MPVCVCPCVLVRLSWWQKCQRVKLRTPIPPPHLPSCASLSLFTAISPSVHVVMRSVAVSRGAWDCHGHDVIPRLLLAVICCTTGLWWTCLIRHVVLYTLLFLSLIAIYFCQTQIMRASMTDLQMALLIDLEVGSKEDRLFSYKSVLWRWFKWKYVTRWALVACNWCVDLLGKSSAAHSLIHKDPHTYAATLISQNSIVAID